MQSKTVLLGFVAAASAQLSTEVPAQLPADNTAMDTTMVPVSPVTIAPVSVNTDPAAVTPNATAVSWTYYNATVTTTLVLPQLTTVCAGGATTFRFNGVEYPATEGQTITVTNCPCTVTTALPILTSEVCTTPRAVATGAAIPSSHNSVLGIPSVAPGFNSASPASPSGGGGSNNGAVGTSYVSSSAPSSAPSNVMEVSGASRGLSGAGGLVLALVGVVGMGLGF